MKQYAGVEDFTEALAKKSDISLAEAHRRVKDFVDVLEDQLLRDDKDGVQFINKITLKKVTRKARKGRNPKNPDEVHEIPERLDVKCVLGKAVFNKLNE